ncbi:unnamed protein product [Ceratitis capitata]|uniref:(Mediterranean fruit fly) hypothetical protein n=1 Tax=Ceratitis capitata TaxID=7213 RepID=A0A811U5V2_CERCA|nr:unnamed protein product [Ceratitis capitata]
MLKANNNHCSQTKQAMAARKSHKTKSQREENTKKRKTITTNEKYAQCNYLRKRPGGKQKASESVVATTTTTTTTWLKWGLTRTEHFQPQPFRLRIVALDCNPVNTVSSSIRFKLPGGRPKKILTFTRATVLLLDKDLILMLFY